MSDTPMDRQSLAEYVRSHPCKGFKPLPARSEIGNFIEWYWSDEEAYADNVHVDGVHVGTVMRSMKTHEAVGVKIFLESVK